MTSPKHNPNDTFWLARYAHNTLAPIFAKAKAIEPTLSIHVELNFSDEDSRFGYSNSLSVNAHWSRKGLFQMSPQMRTQADVDRFAEKVAADVAALRPLTVGTPA
jgi:hypothetical protein